jgi:hypothetical protein
MVQKSLKKAQLKQMYEEPNFELECELIDAWDYLQREPDDAVVAKVISLCRIKAAPSLYLPPQLDVLYQQACADPPCCCENLVSYLDPTFQIFPTCKRFAEGNI